MRVEIVDQTKAGLTKEQTELTTGLLKAAATALALPERAVVTVTFVNNPAIRELNREYRQVDRATDVLSFPMDADDQELTAAFPDLPVELGDLVVSIDKVKEQALFLGHGEERELGYLLVHGFLHLNGFDHGTPEEQEAMFTRQEAILDAYGLPR